jgi:hypothetical protein
LERAPPKREQRRLNGNERRLNGNERRLNGNERRLNGDPVAGGPKVVDSEKLACADNLEGDVNASGVHASQRRTTAADRECPGEQAPARRATT